MQFESPRQLVRRLKLGREEYCQRLLTMLLLDGPYPPWNTRSKLSGAGAEYLRTLHEDAFGGTWPGDPVVFIDKFELPPRHEAERGGAPDYAVLWDDRLWLIALKTEKASHRADQIPANFELAHHHYPDAAIDVLYVTPPMQARYDAPSWGRYAHSTWRELAERIGAVWSSCESRTGKPCATDSSLPWASSTCARRSGVPHCWRSPSRPPRCAFQWSAPDSASRATWPS